MQTQIQETPTPAANPPAPLAIRRRLTSPPLRLSALDSLQRTSHHATSIATVIRMRLRIRMRMNRCFFKSTSHALRELTYPKAPTLKQPAPGGGPLDVRAAKTDAKTVVLLARRTLSH
jgi:hypothetical protein